VPALVALVVSIGIADSLNPSTLGPALLYAVGRHARRDVAEFTVGVFAVSTAGGLVLLFGPGRLLVALVSKPSPHTVHLLELAAGIALLGLAGALWLARAHVARRLGKRHERTARSALLLGAGIMAVELPTAFIYFGAISAVLASHPVAPGTVSLLVLYNALFVAPLVTILVVRRLAGDRGARWLASTWERLIGFGQVLLAGLTGTGGAALLTIGVIGLLAA
jgi:cytochrome c biogenesis protein CcdA